jgi:hypothetical protein
MKHVAPHRWADAIAGKLSPRDAGAIATHADACEKCARARDRIKAAHAAFADIRATPAPEVKWDRVRAQVYWETSSQLRLERIKQPARRASFAVPIASLGAIAALVAAVASGSVPRGRRAQPDAYPGPIAAAGDSREVGVLTLVRGDATVDGKSAVDAFAHPLRAASEIRTGSGEVSVQFGDGSAFAVGPRSVLRLREFDRKAISLEIDGRLDVDVAPRAPGQRFVVIAGSRTVEVRGTGFRVERLGDAVTVACRHGRVAVKDGGGEVEVGAGEAVDVPTGSTIDTVAIRDLASSELAELAAAEPHRLAVWAERDAMTELTAALTVMAPAERGVRVDGAEVGNGPLTVRVVSGRHLVETLVEGAWVSAGWVDVHDDPIQIATAQAEPKKVDPPKPEPAVNGSKIRRKQLRKQLDAVRGCARALHKSGIEDAFIVIELSIDARGAVRFANVVDTDLSDGTAKCVRDTVARMKFPAGPAATWRERIEP